MLTQPANRIGCLTSERLEAGQVIGAAAALDLLGCQEPLLSGLKKPVRIRPRSLCSLRWKTEPPEKVYGGKSTRDRSALTRNTGGTTDGAIVSLSTVA
jgi:hypothetical protein